MEHIKVYRYLNINIQKATGNLSIKLRTEKRKRNMGVFGTEIAINSQKGMLI